jgi:hypothetical protein
MRPNRRMPKPWSEEEDTFVLQMVNAILFRFCYFIHRCVRDTIESGTEAANLAACVFPWQRSPLLATQHGVSLMGK